MKDYYLIFFPVFEMPFVGVKRFLFTLFKIKCADKKLKAY